MEFFTHNLSKILLSLVAAISIVLAVKNYAKIKTFVLEVKTELTKVSWSTRQELMDSTVVVLVITGITAAFIGIVDFLLAKFLSMVFK